MSFSECCRQFVKKYSDNHRAVICKKWIAPLRLLVLTSLGCHLLWRAYNPVTFTTYIIIAIHCICALTILSECKRSERYHKTIEEFERREAVYQDTPP